MNEDLQNYLNEIRRDFSGKPLQEDTVQQDPFRQFEIWFEEAVNAQILDPQAMTLATVNEAGQPSARVVYLRGTQDGAFIFYTNYRSNKARDLEQHPKAALNFLWRGLDRQIRIEGVVHQVDPQVSDNYFAGRPRESQIGAWASQQSHQLKNREELEEQVKVYTNKFEGQEVPRPDFWGGYMLIPHQVEFWQGRPNRLHDRILYALEGKGWTISRLSP
ncbi:MAG: pyridoxamine 5'-phosphate oxidase [Flavobacteriales bacterium]|nr:pyridoxamine 5'-phosphate oxidase [Flavobacteriales bacterium]